MMALLTGALTVSAQAEDAIIKRSYFRDETARRDLLDILHVPFTPYRGLLKQGYQRNVVYWLKLTIRAADDAEPPYVLRVGPTWHDDIRLYDPAVPHRRLRVTGDQYPWSGNEFRSLSNGFRLDKTSYDRDVYLSIQSVHTYFIDVAAVEEPQAITSDWRAGVIYAFYLGLVLIVLLWSVQNFLRKPDVVIGAFAVHQLFTLFYFFFVLGIARIILDDVLTPEWLDAITTMLVILTTLVGLVFHIAFLRPFRIAGWCLLWLRAMAAAPILALILYTRGEITLALAVNAVGLAVFACGMLATVWLGLRRSATDKTWALSVSALRLSFSVLAGVLLKGVLPYLGISEPDALVLNATLIHSALVTMIMGTLLILNQRRLSDLALQQLAAERQKVAEEKRFRHEQNQFVGLLNHELKTPLSVLKLLVADHPKRELAEQSIDNMTLLIERSLLSDRLDNGLPLRRSLFSPAEVLSEAVQGTRQPSRFVVGELEVLSLYNDPDLYRVCIDNLLDNSLKYSDTDSSIKVSFLRIVEGSETFYGLTVCNRLGPAGTLDMDRLFDKYYRAESAKSLPGTGLGLYLVKSLADMMGGQVRCCIGKTAQDEICFTLCLPR